MTADDPKSPDREQEEAAKTAEDREPKGKGPSREAGKASSRGGPKVLRRQANMVVVLWALAPAAIAAVYFYGWRALAVLGVTNAFAFATEFFATRKRGEPVTLAVFVTGSLLALSLPPRVPLWMCALGAVIGVGFAKEIFGGMGRNVFNPALVGRAFLYVSFPTAMTARWVEPLVGGFGALGQWSAVDAVSTATPLPLLAQGQEPALVHLLFGLVPGSLGETCKVLLLLGGAYMVLKKVASWEIMASTMGSFLAFTALFRLAGWGAGADPLHGVLAGGFLYGAIFMATDPVSANRTRPGKVAYGIVIGLATVLIRDLGNFPEGIMFAILLGNMFGPIMEEGLNAWKTRRAGEAAS